FFFFQAEDGIRDRNVTGVQTCALPISKYIASEEDFFIHFLEFTEEEDELLRYKVRIQNFITSNLDITDWERLKREVGKREQYKDTLENVLNRKLENKEFAAYWKKQYNIKYS